jgi:hypothetical protein
MTLPKLIIVTRILTQISRLLSNGNEEKIGFIIYSLQMDVFFAKLQFLP